jgi:hypothetical protein
MAADPPACKDGANVVIEGEVFIDAAKTDSGGDWTLTAPKLDAANKCTVMDIFGKGPVPKGCTDGKRFRATGTPRDQGYALNAREISCF